jgi:hypothetical protein
MIQNDKQSKEEHAITTLNDENTNEQFEEDIIPDEIEQILEEMPQENRKTVERFIFSSFQMKGISSPENEVMKKISSEHIDKFLTASQEDMQKSYSEKRDRKIYNIILTILGLGFVLIVIMTLKDNPDVMEKVIYTIGGLVAGAFGGYGAGRYSKSE